MKMNEWQMLSQIGTLHNISLDELDMLKCDFDKKKNGIKLSFPDIYMKLQHNSLIQIKRSDKVRMSYQITI